MTALSKQQIAEELTARQLAGEAQLEDYRTGRVSRCERCGRSEGLQPARRHGLYLVIKCDCNYQHIRPTPKELIER